MPVAPRIVNDVSYVTDIIHCVAGAVFGEVGGILERHFLLQAQYLVLLECHFLWQAQYSVKSG